MILVLFVLVPLCVVIAGVVVWASRLRPHGVHAFADPADRADPYGEQFVTDIKPRTDDDGFWEQRGSEMAVAGRLAMLPPDADPDVTLTQAADVKYLGKTSGEFVDDLLAKHAPPEASA